jgi:undecaprenyl-diphosphatase
LRDHRKAHPELRRIFLATTQLGSITGMTVVAVSVALVLIIRRRKTLALVWLMTLAGSGMLDAGLKLVFARDRPDFRDAAITENTASFPSGHSMSSVVGYGFLAYLLLRMVRHRWLRVTVVVAMVLLVLAIGFSRLYLGAHYFSDVIGGFALGGCWLTACISGTEAVRRRHRLKHGAQRVEPGTATG